MCDFGKRTAFFRILIVFGFQRIADARAPRIWNTKWKFEGAELQNFKPPQLLFAAENTFEAAVPRTFTSFVFDGKWREIKNHDQFGKKKLQYSTDFLKIHKK
jgi:hypothetical protein